MDVWQRLTSLHVAVIGCGRTGSIAVSMLKRLGVRDLTLVDPDRIEFHNCGEMDLIDQSDVGASKAEALRRRLDAIRVPGLCRVAAISDSMNAPPALEELKRADVLISAADSDAARLGSALLATLYHKVLVDIGTGVLRDAGHSASSAVANFNGAALPAGGPTDLLMGSDVRLVLPGNGCLLCCGGLTNYFQAVSDLVASRATRATVRLDAARRMGSLRSLNQMAVAVGLRMLEDLVATRLDSSTWVRIEYDEKGRISVRYPELHPRTGCTLCQNAGLGDEGLYRTEISTASS